MDAVPGDRGRRSCPARVPCGVRSGVRLAAPPPRRVGPRRTPVSQAAARQTQTTTGMGVQVNSAGQECIADAIWDADTLVKGSVTTYGVHA